MNPKVRHTCTDGKSCTLDRRHAGPCVEQRPCEPAEGWDMYDDEDEDDCAFHAPSEFVWKQREEREARKLRDRTELVSLWREEQRERKREHAARYLHWR